MKMHVAAVVAVVMAVTAGSLVQAHPQNYNYQPPPQPRQPPPQQNYLAPQPSERVNEVEDNYNYQPPPQPRQPPPQQNYLAPQPSDRVNEVVEQAEGMPYDFEWGVQDEDSGNAFSHVENSDGQTTQGEYRVLLPDGRTQVVKFFDNGDGYNAEVTYEKK